MCNALIKKKKNSFSLLYSSPLKSLLLSSSFSSLFIGIAKDKIGNYDKNAAGGKIIIRKDKLVYLEALNDKHY